MDAILRFNGAVKRDPAVDAWLADPPSLRTLTDDPSTPLAEQARVMASARANFGLDASDAGFVEDGTFWKLREVSLTAQAPSSWARRLGVSDLALTLSGRNLGTWTDYTGFDPELNFNGTSNFSTAEFLTQPQVRYFTMRLSVGW